MRQTARRVAPQMQQKRTMILGGGKPTALRQDSLLFACVIAAVVHYVPQDVVFLGLAYAHLSSYSSRYGSPEPVKDIQATLEEWKTKRNLKKVSLVGSGSVQYASYSE